MFEPKPHAVNESRRADPRNGVFLNSLYDNAFDRGLVTFSDDLKVVISPVLRAQSPSQFHQWALLDIEGASLNLPARSAPDPIDWHSTPRMSFRVRNGRNESERSEQYLWNEKGRHDSPQVFDSTGGISLANSASISSMVGRLLRSSSGKDSVS